MTHVTSEIIDKIIYILLEAKFCKIIFLVPWKKQIVHIIWNDFPSELLTDQRIKIVFYSMSVMILL